MIDTGSCVFCKIVRREVPAEILFENSRYLAFLDKYPQSEGHLQLIPKKHCRWIYELPDMGRIFSLAQKIIRGIIPVLGADHVSIGTFGHEVRHAHIWIVPRYGKMTTVAEGKTNRSVHDQTLLAQKLRAVLEKEV